MHQVLSSLLGVWGVGFSVVCGLNKDNRFLLYLVWSRDMDFFFSHGTVAGFFFAKTLPTPDIDHNMVVHPFSLSSIGLSSSIQ